MDAVKIVKDSYHVMAKDLLEFRRNKMQLAALVMMPLIFLVMFGFIFPSGNTQQHMPMGIVNLDQGQASQEFIAQLDLMNQNTSFMDFTNYSSVDEAKTQINQGKIYGAFIIPPGFSENLTTGKSGDFTVYIDNSNPQSATQIQQVLSSTVNGLNDMKAQATVLELSKETNQQINPQAIIFPYVPQVSTTIPGETNYFNFLAPGLMIMIVMMGVMTGIPEAISKEKELGTFDGMLSAPISQISVIIGKTAALCIRGFLQCVIILGLAMLLFGVTVQGSLLLAFFMLLLGIFSFIGLGILAISMSGDQASGTMIVNLLMFPMIFLGGVFYPIQQMPGFMQTISQFIPLTYAADAMRKIILLNAGIGDVLYQMVILIGFGVVTMAIAVPLFRKSMTR
ncbi:MULTISPECIES: ABC transporter permease [Methanobacterium]|jgi:ABC-2 type transport system permease protein|uniref:ABC transporter n=1 Tax=Methanobacterium formicicum TaxID=2162 RepID=A0A090I2X7_METFO|nr:MULTISPECIES: ABC transporter permease [Methanobacterium]KUK75072.1 MAG: ABC-type multidrug transport system, permease component [Methanobacterium sp. 42_16]MBF4474343.1 ABC transporter permease [Methanobacterium formicicum]MDD4810364.1 ABC transporter permease [Methanobacterium formicicum]MDG3548346.1 ABC transporter permease [Methanobacterium formicicum]MDH2660215.1 ABC transporter permease [Methanobacterium formicicum]